MSVVDWSFWLYVTPILVVLALVVTWQADRFAGWFCLDDDSDLPLWWVVVPILLVATVLGVNVAAHGLPSSPVAIPADTDFTVSATTGVPLTTSSAPATVVEVSDDPPVESARPEVTGRILSLDEWYALADCESGEWDANKHPIFGTARWDDQTGSYEGGLHFLNDTWLRAGGARFAQHAYLASPSQQIEIAAGWLARTSLSQWPVCSQKIGVR